MSKLVVLSMAYRGDVYPYVPVATELCRRGHQVTFVVPREFHQELAAEPFTCVHSGSDLGPNALNTEGEWIAKWGMRLGGTRLLQLYFGKYTVPHLEAQYRAVYDALDGADVLFGHPAACIVGAMAAEQRGLPWIGGDLFPMLVPTETQNPLPPVSTLGPGLNRLSWRIARSPRPNSLTFSRDFADFRRGKGLDDTLRSPLDLRISPHLNLGMASHHYVAPAPDWPSNYSLTGFTHWDNDHAGLPEGLDEFLAADDPPLLITLGTLAASSHPERFEAAVRAADALGGRTVSLCSLNSTVDELSRRFDPSQHGVWRFAPLAQVLPRVRGVLHSGSHGTNSMTLAAGQPSVVIPSIFDQVWHAKRQVELGTGVHAKGTGDLGSAIARLDGDESLAIEAQRLGVLLEREDGVATAADRIEAFLGG
ncbi:MAG: hypothetical protein IPF42_09925 [Candidatus Microthrix sp.]|nr:hypothetical protein [Candidatus Microthrix sp.]